MLSCVRGEREVSSWTTKEKAAVVVGVGGALICALGIILLIANCQADAGNTSSFVKKLNGACTHCADKLAGDALLISVALVAFGFGFAAGGFGTVIQTRRPFCKPLVNHNNYLTTDGEDVTNNGSGGTPDLFTS